MTILETLTYKSQYPIASGFVETACIDRGLDSTEDYTKDIGESESYQLAYADCLYYLATGYNIKEQDSSVDLDEESREKLISIANQIYFKYSDAKFDGDFYGYVGESFNA